MAKENAAAGECDVDVVAVVQEADASFASISSRPAGLPPAPSATPSVEDWRRIWQGSIAADCQRRFTSKATGGRSRR